MTASSLLALPFLRVLLQAIEDGRRGLARLARLARPALGLRANGLVHHRHDVFWSLLGGGYGTHPRGRR